MADAWTPARESTLQSWLVDVELLTIVHDKASQIFAQRARLLRLPILVLSAFTTSALLTNASTESQVLQYILAGTSLATTVLSTADRFLSWDARAERHTRAKQQYSALSIDLTELIACPASERDDAHTMLQDIAKRMKSLNDSAPDLPEYVLDAYGRSVNDEVNRLVAAQGRHSNHVAATSGAPPVVPSSNSHKKLTSIQVAIQRVATPEPVVVVATE